MKEAYAGDEFVTKVRDKEIRTILTTTSLIRFENSESCRYRNLRIMVKFYAGSIKKMYQAHSRIQQEYFRLNVKGKIRNVNLLGKEHQNGRIAASIIYQKMMMRNVYRTAFDSVTLYGEDPDYRPDIYGKVGEVGVSVCTLR